MSSLIVSHDLHIMMLEFSVEKLFVPDAHVFDKVTLRKTTIMFRVLNNCWVELQPQLSNYKQYNGSNKEEENFYGGKSVVFAVSGDCLKHKTKSANIKVRVFKEISKYFEIETCYDAGVTYIDIHSLFNGIVKELSERKGMENCFTHYHEREPISRSMKGAFEISNENNPQKSAAMDAYVRLSYFGKSIITEFDRFPVGQFHVSEEMYEGYPYQCTELSREELENGFWGGSSIDLPLNQRDAICECAEYKHSDKRSFIEQSEIKMGEDSHVEMMGVDRNRGFSGSEKKRGADDINGAVSGFEQMEDMSCATLKTLRDENRRGKSGKKHDDDDIDGDFDGRRRTSRKSGEKLKKKGKIKGNKESIGSEKSGGAVRKAQDGPLGRGGDSKKDSQEKLEKKHILHSGLGQKPNIEGTDSVKSVQNGTKKRGKMSLTNEMAAFENGDAADLGKEKSGKSGGKMGQKYRFREGNLIEERGKKMGAIDDAKRRANLKGMATGIVTIGLNEARTKRKCSKISDIVKCPVEVRDSRCYCPAYKLVNCYSYQYC